MRSQTGMKPQDVLVLLKLVVWNEKTEGMPSARRGLWGQGTWGRGTRGQSGAWRQLDLASELGLSQAEVTHSLNRSRVARLIDADKREPMRLALCDFLLHGLQYVFPVEPGGIVRGMPTAHSAPPLSTMIPEQEERYVWPDEQGEVRGQAITPLYPTVPEAARRDPQLYELLALLDALRVGRAREVRIARDELKKRILESSP